MIEFFDRIHKVLLVVLNGKFKFLGYQLGLDVNMVVRVCSHTIQIHQIEFAAIEEIIGILGHQGVRL